MPPGTSGMPSPIPRPALAPRAVGAPPVHHSPAVLVVHFQHQSHTVCSHLLRARCLASPAPPPSGK
eukprot:6812234-Alexandrium_andersonii.AAC.1